MSDTRPVLATPAEAIKAVGDLYSAAQKVSDLWADAEALDFNGPVHHGFASTYPLPENFEEVVNELAGWSGGINAFLMELLNANRAKT